MKNFEISKLSNSEYDYLIIATTYISPISTLESLQNEFKHITGKLIFDLTLINGTSSNRYISAVIENGIVNRSSFSLVKKVDLAVQHNSMNFFANHVEVVENGTIPKALKALLAAGKII